MKTFFWMAVLGSFVGSVSCIGYAGMQTSGASSASTTIREPISFVRDAR